MRIALVFLLLSMSAATAGEKELRGEEIRSLLTGIIAESDTTRQTFARNGDTVFADGRRQTSGRWRVDNDHYCSRWPPGGGWRCYRVLVETRSHDPDLIIWVATDNGERTVNRILPKDR